MKEWGDVEFVHLGCLSGSCSRTERGVSFHGGLGRYLLKAFQTRTITLILFYCEDKAHDNEVPGVQDEHALIGK